MTAIAEGSIHKKFAAVVATTTRGMSTVTEMENVDPMEVFDSMDTDKNGVIDKQEFKVAVKKMHFDDLLKIKDSLSRNELSYNPHADKDKNLGETRASVVGRRQPKWQSPKSFPPDLDGKRQPTLQRMRGCRLPLQVSFYWFW